ncbi:hypothetical protein B0H17DRAFT_1077542 [Mycena rosella]|uniref:Kinesin light chain n=1 Tax=Mycena rosella TaxID=1033263 RepID=A0AAD7GDP0_MYCRO|nr:hypothetical protein B0H17DRAFT_1077542 [Mycena rosella]
MKLDRLEDAETMLQSALKLHREINNRIGQASDLQILGMLYQRLEKIKDAEESHRSALDIYTELNLSVKQGNELQSLGLLCINQQRFSEAEDFLSRAMDIHERAHHPGGQQYTQMLLDYVHKKQEQSDVVEEDVGKQVN